MQVEIADSGPCLKTVEVVYPSSEVDEEFTAKLKELSGSVQFPGFRVGRTPLRLIEKHAGKEIATTLQEEFVEKALEELTSKHGLKILGRPEIDFASEGIARGADFKFTITVEVHPEFELGEYKGLQVEGHRTEVTEEDLDRAVTTVRLRMADLQPSETGILDESSCASLGVEMKVDDRTLFQDDHLPFFLSLPQLKGLSLPALAEELKGKKASDSGEITVTLPEDMPTEELAGASAQLSYEVHAVTNAQIPPADDALAQRAGVADLAALRDHLRTTIQRDRDADSRQIVETRLLDALIAAHQFELPEKLLKASADVIEARREVRRDLETESPDPEDARRLARHALEETAERLLRGQFIVERIAEKEKLFATEGEVNGVLAEIARQHDVSTEAVRRHYEERGLLSELRGNIRERKVRAFLREHATIS